MKEEAAVGLAWSVALVRYIRRLIAVELGQLAGKSGSPGFPVWGADGRLGAFGGGFRCIRWADNCCVFALGSHCCRVTDSIYFQGVISDAPITPRQLYPSMR